MKIALFGGTFDPIHLGHVHLARLAKEALGLDEVRFLPCRISPHKAGLPPASGMDRMEMLRLALADETWAVVDDYELTKEGPSFSYETVEAMVARYPDDPLFWIMGGDQWAALPRWKEPERLAACVEFIVIARGDDPQSRAGYRMHLVKGDHPASSTAIRQSFSHGAESHPWLKPAVSEWIVKRGLYQEQFLEDC